MGHSLMMPPSEHPSGADDCQGAIKPLMVDVVKQQVAAHWDRRAAGFDDDFGHSIRTPAERAAWDRILDLVLPRGRALEALDVGCGTGFLSFELVGRGPPRDRRRLRARDDRRSA